MATGNTNVPTGPGGSGLTAKPAGSRTDAPALTAAREQCPVLEVMHRFGDTWSVIVVALLGTRAHRYNELHRALDGVSRRMLTRTLRGLEADGFVRRTVYPTAPPSVEYDLTDLGRAFLEPLSTLSEWATTHRNGPAPETDDPPPRPADRTSHTSTHTAYDI